MAGEFSIPSRPLSLGSLHERVMLYRYLEEPPSVDPNPFGRLLGVSSDCSPSCLISSHRKRLLPYTDTGDMRLEEFPQRTTRSTTHHDEGTDAARFSCIFAFAGCASSFSNKYDWKNHIFSEHIGLDRWVCTYGACGLMLQGDNANEERQARVGLSCDHNSQEFPSEPKRLVVRSFREYIWHLNHVHSNKPLINPISDPEGDLQRAFAHTNLSPATDKGPPLPVYLRCPAPGCSTDFRGAEALDSWLDHLGQHFEHAGTIFDRNIIVKLLQYDDNFTRWATSPEVAIIHKFGAETEEIWGLFHRPRSKSPETFNDSAYGGSSELTDGRACPRSSDSLPFSNSPNILAESYRDQSSHGPFSSNSDLNTPAPTWPHREPIPPDLLSFIDMTSGVGSCFSQGGPIPSGTELTSPVSSSGDRIAHNLEVHLLLRSLFVSKIVEFTVGWFGAWLDKRYTIESYQATEDQEPGDTASSPSSNSGAASGNRKRRADESGGGRRRKLQRNDDGEEEGEKSGRGGGDENHQRDSLDQDPRVAELRFACPYFKRDRVKYGQPSWKACAHPGWPSIPRLKEHLFRKHMLPRYQCGRCSGDMKNAKSLSSHQKQLPACPVVEQPSQDGITMAQEVELKSRSRIGGSCREKEWKRIYQILFPDDKNIPEPYQETLVNDGRHDHSGVSDERYNTLEKDLRPLVEWIFCSTSPEERQEALIRELLNFLRKPYMDTRTGKRIADSGGGISQRFTQSSDVAEPSDPPPQTGIIGFVSASGVPEIPSPEVLQTPPGIEDLDIAFPPDFREYYWDQSELVWNIDRFKHLDGYGK